ncbi:MAG: DUF1786 domain-containing protein [Methanobrevibacter sp.]|uniref:DUF1786 domain-containing protein n=1 Tax=Methanobrevibacter sp. UBA212 TaxID=1915476 RepID=UPI0025FFCD18|nr:DUF1786 domain-containing protein [Methanobrevibacter sp. UBA212]MBR3156254.1 DUF1786 domain-containing protein [Methanobrevibacter sp.]
MRILAIDVGTGTQDIMIYDTEKELENSIKLVLPSPHLYISQQIRETENDIYFTGEIMGGGKIKKSLLEHMEKGYKVVMEPTCAKTIRDNIEQVKSLGIEIADENKDYTDYSKIKLGDINIKKLSEFLLGYDLDFDFDEIAIAVQDHGYNENMGDRDFRFEKIRQKVSHPISPLEFGFKEDMPEYFTRMQAVRRQIKDEGIEKLPLVMDTKFASIAGMCYDEVASRLDSFIVIDIGNGHTTAASIENGKIQGVFEHHTSSLTGESLERYIKRLASGEITHEEVHEDFGHGAHVLNPITEIEKVIVSGPKRELIEKTNLDWHHAAPGGDVMMTGTIGLIKTILG